MPMNHDFWLFREGERAYVDYEDLLSRHDAPVSMDDEVLRYFGDTLTWIPTFNPTKNERGNGLNWWGPTIINQVGGGLFHRVWTSWAQLFTSGPEQLRLQGLFTWQWPFEEPEHLIREDQLHILGNYEHLEIDRDRLVRTLTTLAWFGEQTATGEFFILHLGI